MREYDGGYRLGYVVVTWNQASGHPSIDYSDLHRSLSDAENERDYRREATAKVGRGERHTIAVLIEPEDGDPADDGSRK